VRVVTRVALRFRGRVQGVGFRVFVYREAIALDLTGHVRNRPDGSVEAEAEGPRERLERWVAAVAAGPRAARVEDVSVEWSEGAPQSRGFAIL
jgi:acylphosphatase